MQDPAIGKEVDGYRIQKVLGRGGMGVVYKAQDTALARPVALKLIGPGVGGSESSLRRFRSEARALARLDSPHIVRVYALRETEIGRIIVMEYVAGRTLADWIRLRAAAAWPEALPIIRQMLTALRHAHGAGVLHRDVKPRNVLLTPAGRVKVADFGLAKILDPDRTRTIMQGIAGTLRYMPPEQVEGRSQVDHRADLYSLGMTLYEMLAGRLPFSAEGSSLAIMRAIVEDEVPEPSTYQADLPPELTAVLMKALAKNPEDRYPDAGAMQEALEAFEVSHGETAVLDGPRPKRQQHEEAARAPRGGWLARLDARTSPWHVAPAIALLIAGLLGMALYAPPAWLTFSSERSASVALEKTAAKDAALSSPTSGSSASSGSAGEAPRNAAPRSAAPALASGGAQNEGAQNEGAQNEGAQNEGAQNEGAQNEGAQNEGAPSGGTGDASREEREAGEEPATERLDGNETAEENRSSDANAADEQAVSPQPVTGRLHFTSDPPGARIRFDGRMVGTAPDSLARVPPGLRTLILSKAGYRSDTVRLRVRAGERIRVMRQLQPIAGTLQIRVHPASRLYVDGEQRGEGQAQYQVPLPAQSHVIQLTHPMLGAWKRRVRVAPGQTRSLEINFEKTLQVDVTAFDTSGTFVRGQIYLDGQPTGHRTPWREQLSVGLRRIEVRKKGYRQVALRIGDEEVARGTRPVNFERRPAGPVTVVLQNTGTGKAMSRDP